MPVRKIIFFSFFFLLQQRYFLFSEQVILDREKSILQACLRVRENHPDKKKVLMEAFKKLFKVYPEPSPFYVSVTCNVILASNSGSDSNQTFSVFWGQDFSESRNFTSPLSFEVRKFQDVGKIKTSFTVQEFEQIFLNNFPDTKTSVHEVISIVYLIRKLGSFYEDKEPAKDEKSKKSRLGVFKTIYLE